MIWGMRCRWGFKNSTGHCNIVQLNLVAGCKSKVTDNVSEFVNTSLMRGSKAVLDWF